ncbi:MAG: hypothetical protein LUE12_07355 [Ruminococcus sp.]|nr:hypothetical protein [Ruminococcus sp.]
MYTDVKLEKGLYSITSKSFTQALAELDPDSDYKGTELEGLDAFERQLKRFDIKVAGNCCDRVEKFFLSTDSAVLFPEYVRRQIKEGMDSVSILPDITAAQTYTDSIDFRALTMTADGEEADIDQLATLPETTVTLASSSSALTKFGRQLACSYESIRKQRLEAFGVILRTLGAQISRAINSKCIEVLSDAAEASTYSSDITYADLASFWAAMDEYDMDVMLASPEMMAKILALDEMKYCVTDFMSGGKVVTPYGVTIVKCSALDSDTAIGIDSKCAAEVIYGTDVIVDSDKLISTQSDNIAASIMCGFAVLTSDAVKKLQLA